jgi:hypothetical protein
MSDGDTTSGLSKILLGVGAFLILLSLTVLEWFRSGPGFFANAGNNTSFHEVHNTIVAVQHGFADISGHVTFGASSAYFSWLGWVAFLVTVGLGVVTVTSLGATVWPARWLTVAASVAAVVLILFALDIISFEGNPPKNAQTPSWGDFIAHSGPAAWAAIFGYLLIMVSALLAPRSR